MMRRETIAVGRRGDRFIADRISMRFLGRTRVIGGAQALRTFAEMIGDNATTAIARPPLRNLRASFGSFLEILVDDDDARGTVPADRVDP